MALEDQLEGAQNNRLGKCVASFTGVDETWSGWQCKWLSLRITLLTLLLLILATGLFYLGPFSSDHVSASAYNLWSYTNYAIVGLGLASLVPSLLKMNTDHIGGAVLIYATLLVLTMFVTKYAYGYVIRPPVCIGETAYQASACIDHR